MPGPDTVSMKKSKTNASDDGFPDSNILSSDRKKKEKSRMSITDELSPVPSNPTISLKSDKKKKKDASSDDVSKSEKKKDKGVKRKAEESLAPAAKQSKVERRSQSESEEDSEILNPYSVSNFRISENLRQKLKAKGIEALFPIQALTFDGIYEGNDLVGRARTGQGKTLAFVLPILESLNLKESFKSTLKQYGRAPSVVVLVPTRELAKQVHADFEYYGTAFGISTVCIYGGAPYGPQQNTLRKGVDVVVGTPGRVKDHLERGSLNLKTLKFRVLDEADEMLNMGFVDDVETILSYVEDASTVQTLLFSATMPDWVKKISTKFLKSSRETVDLVGDEKMKASSSVRHLLLPCMRSAKFQIIPDVVSCYSSGGRAIVFTETKNDASQLASLLPNISRALHGDIAQAQREVTLAGFRSGKFSVLVATDVAARGLDINDVQLVVQCEPPRDVETYIHRSGRTGRAGKTGISVLFYDHGKAYMIPKIEHMAGFKFERVNAPNPADLAKLSCASAMKKVLEVSDNVLPIFRAAADELLEKSSSSAADLLAKALARIAGHTDVKRRSLLSSNSDFVTMELQSEKPFHTRSYAFNALKRLLPSETVEQVKGLTLTADGSAAVFDVPSNLRDAFLTAEAIGNQDGLEITEIEELPELQAGQQSTSFGRRGGFGGRGSGGFGGRGSGSHTRFGHGGSSNRGRGSFNRGRMGRGR